MPESTSSEVFSRLTVDETVSRLSSSAERGLDNPHDVNSRRLRYGSNVLVAEENESIVSKFLSQFYEDPLILMLLCSAGVSLFLGNLQDALSIAIAIILVVGVGFIQEQRSEESLKALQTLVPPNAHLVRGENTVTTLAEYLVPGDLVTISVGDKVPADLRLIEAVHLTVDESSLTGETLGVEKQTNPVSPLRQDQLVSISERTNIAFMGTLVTAGRGKGIVVGTNSDTEFGNIFAMMSEIDKPKTPLQTAMAYLGKQLSMMSFGVIGFIWLVGVIQGRSWLEMFQIGVSLAVAAIPEGLPIIVTVTLALGVLRMARAKAIVRRLPSVETLGSVNVICSDKTGTLTMNKLSAAALYTPSTDAWIDVKAPTSNITPTVAISKLLEVGVICNDAQKSSTGFVGNSVDIGLLQAAAKFGLFDVRDQVTRVHDVPFSSSRKWMATRVQFNGKEEQRTFVKGALERILPLCTKYTTAEAGEAVLSTSFRDQILRQSDTMAAQGMRMLACASGSRAISDNDEVGDLVFTGLVALYDPPRPGVKQSIQRLRESGVRVITITGDNEVTAAAAAREVGIPVPSGDDLRHYVMLGSTLETLEPEQLAQAVENILVFARTSPEMKVSIVRALQLRGDVVAMTGDGVNDAPALKLADIGVSMGSGSDVAKEASDMILVDDDFSTILQAIREGKAIFTNIKSFLTFQLSTSVAALSLIVVTTLLQLPNPLNAMQILWINILMDGPPAQSLGVEPPDPEEMRKPPRSRTDPVLTSRVMKSVLIRAAIIMAGTIFVYMVEMSDKVVTARDTTMSFTSFVFFDLFNALASRSHNRSVFEIGITSNTMFNFAVGTSFLGQLAVIYLPPMRSIFQTEALSLKDLIFLLLLTSSVLWVEEARKYWRRSHRPDAFSVRVSNWV